MPVVAAYEHWRVGRKGINQTSCRDHLRTPLGLVPIATQNPFTFRRSLGAVANAARKLLLTIGIVELNAIELHPAAHEVDMSVIETGQEQHPRGIDRLRMWPTPSLSIRVGAHSYDSISQNRDCLSGRVRAVNRPHLRVEDK